MIDATDIHVRLGHRDILHGASFRALPGEVTVIVGPNGSGKTTLMRALTGEVAYSGTVTLDGEDVSRMRPVALAARRAVLPQSTRMAFPFTVLEVVRLGLLAGVASDETLPHKALRRVGLGGYEGRFFHELSGGEQQRCQLARVLVQVWAPVAEGRPRWLFLDEPVSSLDIGHQLEVMQLARDYAQRGGGVVAVMHDLNLTAMFADQVVLIERGHVTARGTPQDVLTSTRLSSAYQCHLPVSQVPGKGEGPFVLPHGASRHRAAAE